MRPGFLGLRLRRLRLENSSPPYGEISRTLMEGEPRRAYAERIGEGFDRLHSGLAAAFDVGNGARSDPDEPGQRGFCMTLLDAKRLQTRAHAVSRCCRAVAGLCAKSVSQPSRRHFQRRRYQSKFTDSGQSLIRLQIAHD